MISSRSLGRTLKFTVAACLMALCASTVGAAPPDPGGPTRSTADELDQKRYVAAGDRAYVVGSEDGRFPPTGWHIRGEMGGVWAHPIKLLDGYWFSLDGTWLPAARRFTTGAGYVQMDFPRTEGLNVTRTEFALDDSPVVLVGLTVKNPDGRARPFKLTMDMRSELMAAYPWSWTDPNAREFNGQDTATYDKRSGTVTFEETGKDWYAMVGAQAFGASGGPVKGVTGDDYWGPVPPEQRPEYYEYDDSQDTDAQPKGTGARLRWNVNLRGGGEQTLWFAAAGSHISKAEARTALQSALSDPQALLKEKVNERRALLEKSKVDLPDSTLQAAFDWSKLNMADLRITVKDLEVRDVDEGNAYPPPAATLEEVTGIGAGFPDYPWYFGTDGAYTAYPLLVSGQWDTIEEHLRAIREVSRVINGDTGKVVHEVVSDGSVYWGSNDDPGNTNKTAQFATAVEQVWRWTGDDAFRDEMYDFIVDGMRYITVSERFDEDFEATGEGVADDDPWPEGHGMVERPGMGEEKLDVAAYTWQALQALQRMAESRGDTETASWAREQAEGMESAFDGDWWMDEESLYADSLCNSPTEDPESGWVNYCEEASQQLQQRHWINATPMEVLLAPENRAATALDTLESGTFTGETGLFHTGRGGGPDGQGELRVWTLPNSVMAVGEANYGRLGEDQALKYMNAIAEQLDLEMPGALPEIAPSPDYDPFLDFRERAMFMQAWSPYGVQWPVIHHFLGIRPDIPAGQLTVVPDIPESWPGLSVQDLQVGAGTVAAFARRDDNEYTTNVSSSERLDLTIGHTLPADAEVRSVTLDGQPVEDYEEVKTTRGLEIRVESDTAQPHNLVVITR